jgi:hypothetical protein
MIGHLTWDYTQISADSAQFMFHDQIHYLTFLLLCV